jgi:hypothetical protein
MRRPAFVPPQQRRTAVNSLIYLVGLVVVVLAVLSLIA